MGEAIAILVGLVVLAFFVAGPIFGLVAFIRSNRIVDLEQRLGQLEKLLQESSTSASVTTAPSPTAEVIETPKQLPAAAAVTHATTAPAEIEPSEVIARQLDLPPPGKMDLEQFIGKRALGWIAVVVLLFATAFFIRYAFENEWVGPLGRVALGVVAGLLLVIRGRSYYLRGWRVFSQMLTAGGIVLLYLSTFASFGYYQLLPQQSAGVFMFLVVACSGLLALRYDAVAIAVMAVVGGLFTPLLLHSIHDQYVSLFQYLAALNLGIVALLAVRAWPVVGMLAYLGTQGVFWIWYEVNYHPEKLPWAIGFQGVIYVMYLLLTAIRREPFQSLPPSSALSPADPYRMLIRTEALFQIPLVALASFGSAYALLYDDYQPWLGALAIVFATIYALLARALLQQSLAAAVSLGVASSFVALAISLEADAPWIALGWAAEAAVLWWFSLRLQAPPVRRFAEVFAVLAVWKVLNDTPSGWRDSFTLIFNDYALPSLAAVACLATALFVTRRWIARLSDGELGVVSAATVVITLLIGWVVSVDLFSYFMIPPLGQSYPDASQYRPAQMSLSAWWAVYATVVLAIGFCWKLALFRWTALAIYAITIAKVFLFDMAGLDELYRIVAFFVLAVVLGVAAWAYQRTQTE